jgi:hypothetical protein
MTMAQFETRKERFENGELIASKTEEGCANMSGRFDRGFQKELPLGSVFRARSHSKLGGLTMKRVGGLTLLVGAGVGLFLGPQWVYAQACKDEVSMVEASKQALVELTETVKKESLPDFERLNHQKSVVNKLSVHNSMLGGLVSCLEKAAQDTTAPKEQVAAAKAQHDASAKLREKIEHERGAIKDAQASKDAKLLSRS